MIMSPEEIISELTDALRRVIIRLDDRDDGDALAIIAEEVASVAASIHSDLANRDEGYRHMPGLELNAGNETGRVRLPKEFAKESASFRYRIILGWYRDLDKLKRAAWLEVYTNGGGGS